LTKASLSARKMPSVRKIALAFVAILGIGWMWQRGFVYQPRTISVDEKWTVQELDFAGAERGFAKWKLTSDDYPGVFISITCTRDVFEDDGSLSYSVDLNTIAGTNRQLPDVALVTVSGLDRPFVYRDLANSERTLDAAQSGAQRALRLIQQLEVDGYLEVEAEGKVVRFFGDKNTTRFPRGFNCW
jgi:hypothetical protein